MTRSSSLPRQWDAIVIGAGPAGALIARQLALGGRRVLLVDKKRFPRPKVCGACINARALSALEGAGLGSEMESLGGEPLQTLEVLAEGRRARVSLPQGLAVGRAEFDQALANAAVAAGAQFEDGIAAKVGTLREDYREVHLDCGAADLATLTASVVLAADGLQHSCLAHNAAFDSEVAGDSLIGVGATIPLAGYALKPGVVRMVAGRGGYVGIVGIGDERLNIAAAVETAVLRRQAGPAALIVQLLQQAGETPPAGLESAEWHGTAPLTRTTRRVADSRLFLLGDATGYVEPFTGEGIAWALCSALLAAPLAAACIAGQASPLRLAQDWHVLHESEVQRRQHWCRRLAWVLRSPWRRRLAVAAAASLPSLAERIAGQMNEPFVSCTT